MDLKPDFILGDLDALLEHYDKPVDPVSIAKELDALNPEFKAWLAHVKFIVLASAGPNGLDCSCRGDENPIFQIIDDTTLLMADWRGNNRIDTLRNLASIPAIGILCFIPGVGEVLRIGGSATITIQPDLLDRFARDVKRPRSVIHIKINRVFFHCARSIKRSSLWDGLFPEDGTVPTAGLMAQAVKNGFDGQAYDAALPDRQRQTLWSDD